MIASTPETRSDMASPPPENREDFRQLTPNPKLGRTLVIVSWILTLIVWVLVGAMQRLTLPIPDTLDLSILPAVNATLNSLVAVCLVAAIYSIVKLNRADLHKNFIYTAVGLSIVFLLSYVTYHITHGEVKYGGEGALRTIYFFFLITHIILAAVSFPFILLSLAYAISNQFTKHRRIVKIAFPMWLYVAVTGPIVFLMLRPYY
ncbi:MAG: DUF420 domain-containing protein [Verrucomicrobiota bacterium]